MTEKKTYRVVYEEVLHHVFYIEAESSDDAATKIREAAWHGELDFSNGEIEYSDVESVAEYKETSELKKRIRLFEDLSDED